MDFTLSEAEMAEAKPVKPAYTLYWSPGTASLAPLTILEEVGVPYELVRVDTRKGEHRDAAYRAIHPYGKVPAMMLPDGRPLFESAAICLHLGEAYPQYGLVPESRNHDRARLYQWMFFAADTLYPSYQRWYHADHYIEGEAEQAKLKARTLELLDEQWAVIETQAARREWLVGNRFSIADIYVAMLSTWHPDPAGFARRFPETRAIAEAVAERPSWQRALALNGGS
ncbi:glutathione S-transferase [Tistlia consotensis]|uniref:Glutathione S-transferase n=1 Tax=Tistlia consotensis USBA 355 TaxID=560819 RepID=A0A1Y6C7F9_9PROT|nr:glutathione S-transferase family protein [Tistlia consotensis]SMF40584.1 glutathione S-transferase [Tistlia consotensis USBA 355]SNR74725.1 glutathione S-transferase [Tistlia consotensis]